MAPTSCEQALRGSQVPADPRGESAEHPGTVLVIPPPAHPPATEKPFPVLSRNRFRPPSPTISPTPHQPRSPAPVMDGPLRSPSHMLSTHSGGDLLASHEGEGPKRWNPRPLDCSLGGGERQGPVPGGTRGPDRKPSLKPESTAAEPGPPPAPRARGRTPPPNWARRLSLTGRHAGAPPGGFDRATSWPLPLPLRAPGPVPPGLPEGGPRALGRA